MTGASPVPLDDDEPTWTCDVNGHAQLVANDDRAA
jgi:hypothetical protein